MRRIGLAVVLALWTLSKRGMLGYTGLCIPKTELSHDAANRRTAKTFCLSAVWIAAGRYTDRARCVTRII
jgi:hypothetical protein